MAAQAESLQFPNFDDIKVSTKTFIAVTNISLNMDMIRPPFIPITDYIVIPKKRGRKKKNEEQDPNKDIPDGSVITIEYKGEIWGVDLKKKKKGDCTHATCKRKATYGVGKGKPVKCHEHAEKDMVGMKGKGNYFRNAATIVMMIEGKRINFKVSRNGKFQMTGCKYDSHAEAIIKFMWSYIKLSPELYEMNDKKLKVLFIPAMRNIDFPIGFLVNRENLDMYINTETDYRSLLETSFGYTGVNIKIPVEKKITDLQLKTITYENDGSKTISSTPFTEYLDTLTEKERDKKLKKERNNTFLVFHSGKTIVSGLSREFMRDSYNTFIDIIRDCHELIEEKLDIEE